MAEFVAKNGNAGLYYGSGSPLAYTKIVGVKSFTPGAITAEELDATDFDSPSGMREFVNGLKSASEGSIVLNHDPGDTTQEYLRTALGGAAIAMKAVFDDKQATFSALIKGFDTPLQVGAIAEATVTIKMTGAITWANVT
jgi:hypothetical protein